MNLIILEGPDGAGKTTLARALAQHGYHRAHAGPPPASANSEEKIFQRYLRPLLKVGARPAVFDRWHLGEPIYGRVCRGKTYFTPRAEDLVERQLAAVGAQVVICLPPWRHVLVTWLARKRFEYVKTADQLREIYWAYYELYRDRAAARGYVLYDYTRHRPSYFVESLLAGQNETLPAGLTGYPGARFLLVGERAADRRSPPFLTTQNCSGFLYDCLRVAGYEERDLCFANAVAPRDHEKIQAVLAWARQRRLTIVALGRLAERAALSSGEKFYALAHPQFVKRFRQEEKDQYICRLREIRRAEA